MQFQKAVRPLRGEISVPGDKSISHRAVMFGAISEGTTEVTNFLQCRLSLHHLLLPQYGH
jgi:3-phosphoshikimate 1-carboxyvinyltransferase